MFAASAGGPADGQSGENLKLSNCLGILRDDPDNEVALSTLAEIVEQGDADRLGEEPVRLLEVARAGHDERGELAAAADLIAIEVKLSSTDAELRLSLLKELGRLRSEHTLEPALASAAYEQAKELAPDDREITDALRKLEQAEGSWRKFAKRFVEEADSATDISLKTSLLVRAACLVWQYKKKGRNKETDSLFKTALKLDPANTRAALLYEHTLRQRGRWKELVSLLLAAAEEARERQERINMYVRAGRVCVRKLEDTQRAAACYERVLDFEPTNTEGLEFLSQYFTEGQQWDHLAGLYEDALNVRQLVEVEQGLLLQAGMVHWRMRERPQDAEAYFGRLRRTEPAHLAALEFYREYLDNEEGAEELVNILTDALRVTEDPDQKRELSLEVANRAQGNDNMPERSIDAWKHVLRLDPTNREAATILKDLYAKSHKWNALVEILKNEVEALPDEAIERKIELLREQAVIYRDYLRMDGMVINTFNAILRLKPSDSATLAELGAKYRDMGRYNDLIEVLTNEANSHEDSARRIDMYLEVANLWIEHFSNYNQATGPLEQVLELDPDNREALTTLKDIYEKKRAWKQLYDVLKKERSVASDPTVRLDNTMGMAKLASERLHSYADAIALWREVVDEQPDNAAALEALEKLAEREQDAETLALVLERQVSGEVTDPQAVVRSLLKLGAMYSGQLEQPDKAFAVWKRVLELDPSQGRAQRSLRDHYLAQRDWDSLEGLFARDEDWEGLVDVLSTEADDAEDAELKIALSLRAAKVVEERIGERARAARSYERVLAADPSHVVAARALVPLYEAEEKWARQRAVIDCLLEAVEDSDEQLQLLKQLRELCQVKLRDGEAAFGYAVRAYALAPGDSHVLAQLESAAAAAAAHDRLLELYLSRASELEGEEALPLHRAAAALAADRLDRVDVAAEQYRAVLALVPSDTEALAALEKIARAGQDATTIVDVLRQRLGADGEGAVGDERFAILKELADLEEGAGNADAAAACFREMSELEPGDTDVLVALDRLAAAADRHEELAEILERRRNAEPDSSTSVELGGRLAALFLGQLDDARRAVEVFADVLEVEPTHGASTTALEGVVEGEGELATRARTVLEQVYEKTGRFDKLAASLEKRLEAETDDEEVRQLRLRVAEISGSKLGDAAGAYGALEAAFLGEPSDPELWDRLADAAEAAEQHPSLATAYAAAINGDKLEPADAVELSRRVAALYDEILDQRDEAESYHRRVLDSDPLDDPAFEALKELFTSHERWEDLQGLYRVRVDETVDAGAKLDLLLQTCFLYEEILDKPELAIDAYQAVLELEPDHGPALRTLERLYESTERWRDLATLLRGDLDQAEGQDQLDLMFRLGQLHETKLGEHSQAVEQYEGVLNQNPTHLRSQEALTRLLAVEGLRQRIAEILEPIYESQGAYRELAEVLTIQLGNVEDDAQKVDMLMRVGELYESRLRDPEGAFNAYAQAAELDPADGRAREALADIASGREVFRRQRAEVLERTVERAEGDDALQAEILLELAILQDEFLEEREAAERAYKRLLTLDGDNPDVVLKASRALERIHSGRDDQASVAQDLERQAEFEPDSAAQADLLVRLANLYEHELEQPERAIEVHRRRLENDAGDRDATAGLERLFEKLGRFADLVEVLEARSQEEGDDDVRRELGQRIGTIFQDELEDNSRAIDAFSEVVNAFGPDRDSLAALATLYETEERWADLVDVYQQDEEQREDPAERAGLRFNMAEIMRQQTGEPERAIELYESVLEEDASHAGALAALDAMIGDEESQLRFDAARVAAPRHEAAGSHEKLLGVLEVMAAGDDEGDQLDALRRAALVADTGLGDAGRAFAYLGRALAVANGHEDFGAILEEYERLADAANRWGSFVETLQSIASELYGDVQIDVFRKVAQSAKEKQSDAALAREYYGKLLEERPDDQDALNALEHLDEEVGDYAALIQTLKRKTELTDDGEERVRLLARQADIFVRGLDDGDSAIEVLEELLMEASSSGAYESLELLYTGASRWDDLASMYEQQLDRDTGDKVELRYKLARNAQQQLGDNDAALEHLREGTALAADHAPTIALLEALMGEPGDTRAMAAEILEPGYLHRMEWPKLTAALEARVEAEQDIEESKRLLVRLAQIHEDQLEDFDGTMEIYARLFRTDPRDDDVWETLSRLAKVGDHWERLAKIYASVFEGEEPSEVDDEQMAKLAMNTGALFEERVHNLHRAAEFYAKVLAFEPTDASAFSALESVYQRREDHSALFELYRTQADEAQDDEQRVALLHKRAKLLIGPLERGADALEVYREILELDPQDTDANQALDGLLAQSSDHEALADHLRARIDVAVGTPDESALKLRLAKLSLEQLDDADAAIDLLEEMTQADPPSADAIAMLEALVQGEGHRLRITQILDPLYEQLDEWRKRIVVGEAQLPLLDDPAEVVRILGDIGRLHEERGDNVEAAFDAWSRALAREPDNEDARIEVDRLAAMLDDWDLHVDTYELALKNSDDPTTQATLLTTLARVHDEKRGDLRAAIDAYNRLLKAEPDDPGPLDALEVLHMLLGDWRGLVSVLERKVETSYDTDERCELLRRIGSVHDELLEDPEAAVASFLRATEENDGDTVAWELLDRMYARQERPDDLISVIERRIELAEEPSDRIELGLRLGSLLDLQLRRPDDAIEAYRRVLDDDGTQADAVTRLAQLFERQQQWPELLENLELQASTAEDAGRRVALRCKAGEIHERELDDPSEAVEAYRQALDDDPVHEGAVGALMRLSHNDDLRGQITEILDPLLREHGRWDQLVTLVEAGLSHVTDPYDRRAELERLAEIHEQGRQDGSAAFDAYTRALAEDPVEESLHANLQRLAAELPAWDRLADVLDRQAKAGSDPSDASQLYRSLGRVCEEELQDDARAVTAYVHASEQDDDAIETLVDLDRLYLKTERHDELLAILERRVAMASDPQERTDLLIREGELREQKLSDQQGAFVAYREVLEGDPVEQRALEGLERVGKHPELAAEVLDILDSSYREMGAMDRVVGLYDIRVQLAETDGEKLQMLQEAARMWEQELGQLDRALGSMRQAFGVDPTDLGVLEDIERLAEETSGWEGLRGMIEALVEEGRVDGEDRRELSLRAADWYRDKLGDPAAEEASLRTALAVDTSRGDLHERLANLLRVPEREGDLLGALYMWAREESDPSQRRALFLESAQLAETALGDIDTAADCVEEALAVDADDAALLAELLRLRTAQERFPDVASLLSRQLQAAQDASERQALLYQLAEIYAGPLSDAEHAIGTYQTILKDVPTEERAVSALDGLFQAGERWAELQSLLEQRLAVTEEAETRISLRVRLAGMVEQRFGDAAGAIDQLRQVLLEDATHAGALDELERLYTADGNWNDLTTLLSKRAEHAVSAQDVESEMGYLRRLCSVYEEKLTDADSAVMTYTRLLERAPEDAEVLSALKRLHQAAGRWAQVADYSQRLLNLLEGAEAITAALEIADIATEHLDDSPRAEAALQMAFEMDQGNADTRQRLKDHYEKNEQHESLAGMLAQDLDTTEDATAKVELLNRIAGLFKDKLGEPARAVEYLEQAVALVPEDREALLMLCDLYIAADRQNDAIPVLEKIIESYGGRRSKEVAVYQHKLGQAYEGMGQMEEAAARYDAAFKIDLTNVNILRDLGRLCLRNGDLERAQKTFRALLLQKLGPDSGITKAEVYFHLGEISFKGGDKVKAKSMLQRAVSEAGEYPDATALLEQL